MPEIAGIILAAGRSTRMGSNKLLAEFRGKPLVQHVVEAALGSTLAKIYVVTGHESKALEKALEGLELVFLHNSNYADGMASSIKMGFSALPESVSGAIVLLGDMPLISVQILDTMIGAFENDFQKAAVVPVVNGKRGNPVLISRVLFHQLMHIRGDTGARQLLDSLGNKVLQLPVDTEKILVDVDTPEALASLS